MKNVVCVLFITIFHFGVMAQDGFYFNGEAVNEIDYNKTPNIKTIEYKFKLPTYAYNFDGYRYGITVDDTLRKTTLFGGGTWYNLATKLKIQSKLQNGYFVANILTVGTDGKNHSPFSGSGRKATIAGLFFNNVIKAEMKFIMIGYEITGYEDSYSTVTSRVTRSPIYSSGTYISTPGQVDLVQDADEKAKAQREETKRLEKEKRDAENEKYRKKELKRKVATYTFGAGVLIAIIAYVYG